MSLAISVEDLSKIYHLGNINRGLLLRDAKRWMRHKLGRKNEQALEAEDALKDESLFWALKDVSFEIKQGETLGIIGRNGAGKSTLLKILSRITAPSSGTVKIRGKVGSLLEVGTGFHPELSGRDNLYLYGSIMGMRRDEIKGKFDDIVSFSELERFIDTPVKRYSSGMYVRLAFSIAAFLEPEILIVDEALSVGDQQFQNKCLQRIDDLIRDGRTFLFVSHGAALIKRVCKRSICLKEGKLIFDGPSDEAIERYMDSIKEDAESVVELQEQQALKTEKTEEAGLPGNEVVQLLSVSVVDEDQQAIAKICANRKFSIEIRFKVHQGGRFLRPGCIVFDAMGNILFWTIDTSLRMQKNRMNPGEYRSLLNFPAELFSPGHLIFSVGIGEYGNPGVSHAMAQNIAGVVITDDFSESSLRGGYSGPLAGLLRPRMDWVTE